MKAVSLFLPTNKVFRPVQKGSGHLHSIVLRKFHLSGQLFRLDYLKRPRLSAKFFMPAITFQVLLDWRSLLDVNPLCCLGYYHVSNGQDVLFSTPLSVLSSVFLNLPHVDFRKVMICSLCPVFPVSVLSILPVLSDVWLFSYIGNVHLSNVCFLGSCSFYYALFYDKNTLFNYCCYIHYISLNFIT